MITTKRYDYVTIDSIQQHPDVSNHRALNTAKVNHYADDILKNGLLEPLVVWERNHGEFFLVGGFHRLNAIKTIRTDKPDYYDRIDVRVVSGEIDEMRALNLKLNADRLDARISDYFDTVIYLNNANWEKAKVASFFDRSESWIDEIIRFVPSMDARLRKMIETDKVSWTKAKQICRQILEAKPGEEKETADRLIGELTTGTPAKKAAPRPLTLSKATRKLQKNVEANPGQKYTIENSDLMSLFMVMGGKTTDDEHLDRVRAKFPGLLED